ncbi:transmembrane protein 144b [Hypomesus transpacificus]|uniref:transmembrane protein 144b n=1 Tax=Hypomesus transpacificus TaxID=137520 RepID=UPI001F0881C4|nr:transmembrane protein 144b [Hypomesus transpacificus]
MLGGVMWATDPQHVSSPLLNYCGAGLCFLSGLTFFFVRTDVEAHPHAGSPLLHPDRRVRSGCEPSESWIEVIGPETKRLIGCSLATAYGLLDGLSFVPILYIKSRASCQDSIFYGASLYDPDYVYAQCCGIFLTSTVYFLIYCALMTNRPQVPSRAVLPGFASGLMWTLANYCWFLANIYLSSMVTFPIVTALFPMLGLRSGGSTLGMFGVQGDQGLGELLHPCPGLLYLPDWLHPDCFVNDAMKWRMTSH